MSSYLLDTHVVVWLAREPGNIPRAVLGLLVDASGLYVSAASAYEVAQKTRLGKLPGGSAILARWDELVREMMAEELPLSGRDMLRAGSLTWDHRDPFDRMLVAQAQSRGLEIVTRDGLIHSYREVPTVPWE